MNRSTAPTARERSAACRWLSDVRRARAARPRRTVRAPTDLELRRRTVAAIEDDVAVRLAVAAATAAADGREAA